MFPIVCFPNTSTNARPMVSTAIQFVGWNHGGQDGGDPSLDTDPGMGTWEELHQAILHARSKGVKIILFGKPIFADMSTEWYKKELHKYEAIDPLRQQVRIRRLQLHHTDAVSRHQQSPPRHHGCLQPGLSRYCHARI